MLKLARIRTTLIASASAAAIGLLSLTSNAAADWGVLGSPLNVPATMGASQPAIATIAGVPYVAFQQSTASARQIYVERWNGTTWAPLGGSLNVYSAKDASNPAIASVNGVPYVAWAENGNIYAKRWTGSAWEQVGGTISFGGGDYAQTPSLMAIGSIPYVAFTDEVAGGAAQLYVSQWNGANWALVGGSLNRNSAAYADNPSIANVGGVPWVAWIEQTGVNTELFVGTYSGGTWTAGLPLSTAGPRTPSLIAVGSVPYVAWAAYNGTGEPVHVERMQKDYSWTSVGGPLLLDPVDDAGTPSLTSIGGAPLVAWEEDYQNGSLLLFRQWDGSAWNPVGGGFAPDNLIDTPVVTGVGGVPYVAWVGTEATHEVRGGALLASFSSEQALATDTSALLSVRVGDSSTAPPIEFQYGPGTSLTQTTAPQTTDAAGSATLDQTVTGLAPSTTYSWRAIESDGTTTTAVGPTQTFTTEPKGGAGVPGKVELVVCKNVKKTVVRIRHHKRRRVRITVQRCTAKLVSGPVTFTTAARAR
jgi:hypothetical protein